MRHERILPTRPKADEKEQFSPSKWWHWWKSLGVVHCGYMDDNTTNAYTWKVQPHCHWKEVPWKFEAIAGVSIRTAFVDAIPAKDIPLLIETLQDIYDNFLYLRHELEAYEKKINPPHEGKAEEVQKHSVQE